MMYLFAEEQEAMPLLSDQADANLDGSRTGSRLNINTD
jgi:hypothetical protein